MTPKQLVSEVANLVALPDICLKIGEMAEDPLCSAIEMAQTISQDPALTAKLLKIANSPFYGFPSRVETISRAISIVGTRELKELVIAASVIAMFTEMPHEDVLDIERFWHHSIMTGLISRHLGSKIKTPVLHKERLFVAGLLHDVGRLVMAMKIPELVRVMLERSAKGKEPLNEIERLVFNMDHGEVGEELMKLWNLPNSLSEVARFHHQPELADDYVLETAIIHIASGYATMNDFSTLPSDERDTQVDSFAWEITGLEEMTIFNAINDSITDFSGVLASFLEPSSQQI
ncbi:MAG: HDOD domain-containing protein [Gammaproteobacteria bacterium]|nr:HDOD domain-containing protein [Gammaproteobacteria bacterium]